MFGTGQGWGGFQKLGWNPNPQTEAQEMAFVNFDDAFNAFLQPYLQSYGPGSTFYQWLQGAGRNQLGQQFLTNQQSEIGQGVDWSNLTSALDWLKQADPTQSFYAMSSRDRGEGQQQPFVRFLTR